MKKNQLKWEGFGKELSVSGKIAPEKDIKEPERKRSSRQLPGLRIIASEKTLASVSR